MEPDESKRWLTPGVGGIGAASFLDDTGHEIATSLLPRFLTGTLGAPAAALGLIEGLADAASGFLKLAGGALADDPASRKATAVGGYVTTSIFSSAVGLVGSVWTAGVLRALAWGARGLRVPARNALLADGVHPSAYGRAYGFERAMDNLGAIAGPLLALLLVSLFSVRTAILLSIVPGLMAAAAIVYAIRHIPKVTGKRRDGTGLKIRPVLRSRLGPVLRGVAAFEVGNVAVTLLILRATEVLTDSRGLERATQIALLLYLAYNLTGTLASFLAGRRIDRSGAELVLVAGVGAFAVAYVTFALVGTGILVLLLAFAVAGVGIGFVETAEHAVVAARAPEGLRGSSFGLLAFVQSIGNFAASGGAGLIWTLISPRAAFLYLACWMGLSFVLLLPTTRPLRDDALRA